MTKKKNSLTGLLRPYSMESKAEYLTRFLANREMKETLPKTEQRVAAAKVAFNERWDKAPVTVTKADGNKFFID